MRLLSSLSNRIFLASAALTLVSTGIAMYVVNARVTVSAEDELRRGLLQTGAFVAEQRATMSDVFTVQARLVADLPKLKALVDTGDRPTVERGAADYQRQLGSDLFLVTDRAGRVLASVSSGVDDPALTALPTIQDAREGRESATFWLGPQGILQVVSVPIAVGTAPPEVLGTLSVGFLLGDALAARLKTMTGSEIAFATGGRVTASTLPAKSRAALAPLLGRWGISQVSAGEDDYLALLLPLAPARNASGRGRTPDSSHRPTAAPGPTRRSRPRSSSAPAPTA